MKFKLTQTFKNRGTPSHFNATLIGQNLSKKRDVLTTEGAMLVARGSRKISLKR